jgi:RNA polymerase sigma factor (sigma-70 family)
MLIKQTVLSQNAPVGEVNDLVSQNLGIVGRVVGRVVAAGLRPWIEASELVSAGQMALVLAARDESRRGDFGPFAYRAVRHAVIDELRRLSIRQHGRSEMPEDVNRQPDGERNVCINTAMLSLPADQFRVVHMYFWGSKSQSEIAAAMGVDQSTLSRMLDKAKKNLKDCINRESQTPISVKGEIKPNRSA